MRILHPYLNAIPLTGMLVLLATFWRSWKLNRELKDKLDDVETDIVKAVNTSRECGKDLTNKTIISLRLKQRVGISVHQIQQMNGEESLSDDAGNTTTHSSLKETSDGEKDKPAKQKIRQNRLQMYGVRFDQFG